MEYSKIHKIIITGPESCGKTTLCRALSDALQLPYAPEYARKYLETLERPYQYSDLQLIARQQYQERAIVLEKEKSLVCDTSFLVLKIWSEYKYQTCAPYILEQLENLGNVVFILCRTDIPWEADPLREHPQQRHILYNIYKKELQQLPYPFIEVSGSPSKRLEQSLFFIKNIESKK